MDTENLKLLQRAIENKKQFDSDVILYDEVKAGMILAYQNGKFSVMGFSVSTMREATNRAGYIGDTKGCTLMREALSENIEDNFSEMIELYDGYVEQKRKQLDYEIKRLMVSGLGLNIDQP